MEPFTLNRNFLKQDVIDGFHSIIWTERYFGDSEVELVVPLSASMVQALSVGTFLGIPESDEIMSLETVEIEDGKLKFKGISLLPWMNNRFVRTSPTHADRFWFISASSPGKILWDILFNMCCVGSPYLDGTINTGISNPETLAIPGLGLKDYDISGDALEVGVPYGPVYDAQKEIATTYQIGMSITLDEADEDGYILGFRSYKGLDRTSGQTDNSVVRFSPQMDSLTGIKELQSIATLKTLVYAFAPGNPGGLTTVPGVSSLTGEEYTGFDLRALLLFAEDITTDMVGGSAESLVNVLNSRAFDGLIKNRFIKAVDGEIVPLSQFKFGVHYNLGDLIEMQGNTGAVQTARVTEYIRSQDEAGQTSYPGLTMVE